MSMGTLFVNETALPVTHVSFRAGEVVIHADSPSRVLAKGDTEVRLHGSDGSVIFVERVPWPKTKIRRSDIVTVEVPLKLTTSWGSA